jgi:hypothetical protein
MTEMENRSSKRFRLGLSAMPSAAMKTAAMKTAAMESAAMKAATVKTGVKAAAMKAVTVKTGVKAAMREAAFVREAASHATPKRKIVPVIWIVVGVAIGRVATGLVVLGVIRNGGQ